MRLHSIVLMSVIDRVDRVDGGTPAPPEAQALGVRCAPHPEGGRATWSCAARIIDALVTGTADGGQTDMRVLIAQMSHETNTFSPVPTPLARFARGGVPGSGAAVIAAARGTATCLGGFIAVCEAAGVDFYIVIAAGAAPSGPVARDAYEYMAERIVAAAKECDVLLLDLHGAMVAEHCDDGEGELLRRIRAVAPSLPIALALDMHANVYPDMVRLATVIAGYHTYPHIDMYETAVRAGHIALRAARGEITPVMRYANLPMLPHVMRQGTDDSPNRELQARAIAMEHEGVLAASVFTGFPHADIHEAGLSVVIVDGDAARAERCRDELLDMAWRARAEFVYQGEALATSVARAAAIGNEPPRAGERAGPVLLLDHYDNCASGGTMDTTEVLAEILRQGLSDVAVFAIFDPEAVATMAAAGVGAELTITLGGKTPMASIPVQSQPLTVRGRVRVLADGRFRITGAMGRGTEASMGRTAVLDLGNGVEVVVISRHVEPIDPACFESIGITPTRKRFLMLKSRIHYRVGFRDLVRTVVECAGVGVCTSDYGQLRFTNVRRPIYPLDGVNAVDWRQAVGGSS